MGIVKDMTETDVHNANLHKGKEKKVATVVEIVFNRISESFWKLF